MSSVNRMSRVDPEGELGSGAGVDPGTRIVQHQNDRVSGKRRRNI